MDEKSFRGVQLKAGNKWAAYGTSRNDASGFRGAKSETFGVEENVEELGQPKQFNITVSLRRLQEENSPAG